MNRFPSFWMNGYEIGLKGNGIISRKTINTYIVFEVTVSNWCVYNVSKTLKPNGFLRIDSSEISS